MRLLLIIVITVGAAIVFGSSAEAQNYPWCAEGYKDGSTNCGFVTLQQCQDTVRGSGGFCMQNNTYRALPGPHASVQRRRSTQRP
jgi:Protein of unknown function (DUF3551)